MKDDDPGRFHAHAEYCSLQAEQAVDPIDKKAWLKVADDWLQMAEAAQRRRGQGLE
jgi:hypothetical protein